MDPYAYNSYFLGFAFLPLLFLRFTNDWDEYYLLDLNKSELEAVMRVRDQFTTRSELRRFVRGLRG